MKQNSSSIISEALCRLSMSGKICLKKLERQNAQRRHRGSFYAILKRISSYKDYFERAWKLQPRFTAVLGPSAEEIFLLMQRARREIEVSSQMLANTELRSGPDRKQFERDVWEMGSHEPEKDRVGTKLTEFRARTEALCRPIIDREFGRTGSLWWRHAPPTAG